MAAVLLMWPAQHGFDRQRRRTAARSPTAARMIIRGTGARNCRLAVLIGQRITSVLDLQIANAACARVDGREDAHKESHEARAHVPSDTAERAPRLKPHYLESIRNYSDAKTSRLEHANVRVVHPQHARCH